MLSLTTVIMPQVAPPTHPPESDGLYEDWSALLHCHSSSMLDHIVHSQHIVTVDTYALHPIASGTRHNPITSIVVIHRRGDSVAIVTTERGGEVNTLNTSTQ